MRIALLFAAVLILTGCDEEPPHPNQQAVNRAEKLTDHAIEKAENAESWFEDMGYDTERIGTASDADYQNDRRK